METEREAKLLAADAETLAALAHVDRLADVVLGAAVAVDEVDRYLDTETGDLARAGWACRIRTRAGRTIASLKGPRTLGDDPGIHRRAEVEGPTDGTDDPGRWPSSGARELLDELRDGRALVERFRLEQRRVERPMAREGRPLGTLSLDTVTVRRGTREAGTFHVAELELLPEAEPDPPNAVELLGRLVSQVASLGGFEPDASTKLERALDLLDR